MDSLFMILDDNFLITIIYLRENNVPSLTLKFQSVDNIINILDKIN